MECYILNVTQCLQTPNYFRHSLLKSIHMRRLQTCKSGLM